MLQQVRSSVPSSQSPAKDLFLCIISALLLIISFPNFNLWISAWFGFVPLFFALENKSKGKAFLLAYLTGIIFWWGIIYWLVHVTFIGTFVLILYLALYFGVFGLFYSSVAHRPSPIAPFILASAWTILEYLRAHLLTGFPWALLGYSQYLNLPVIQISDITGAWGVSFLMVMINVVIYKVMGNGSWVMGKRQKIHLSVKPFILTLFFIFFCLTYGVYKLYLTPNTYDPRPIKISVIQGNIPQELKWMPDAKEYILDKHIELTEKAAVENPDLIVWPEAALPAVLEEEPALFERVSYAAAKVKTSLLVGAVTLREDFYYNSALLISSQGETLVKYNKLHLVPFGEYIPLKKTFPFLETIAPIGDIRPGQDYTIFELPSLNAKARKRESAQTKFAVLICFEDLFPELSRRFVKNGAQFLVNITNDAWYKKTSAPYQHLQASVFRAVENRVNLARAANTGVSGFIAPNGKIISLVRDRNGRNIFIDGFKYQEIAIIERQPTFYACYGDVFIVACFLFLLYGIIHNLKNITKNVKLKA